jgi:signal transduction histidine kinase/DNA-binding NarL/FixJ family response regulator
MKRFSIARSLRLALIGLTIVLAVIAALGVASLYRARQRYENTLVLTSNVSTAGANLVAGGVTEEEVLREVRGRGAAAARRDAALAYDRLAATALALAASDPPSVQLIRAQIATESAVRRFASRGAVARATAVGGPLSRARALAAQLQTRQLARVVAARSRARSDSRRAIAFVGGAGLLALVGALALIASLVGAVRRPLDALVSATGDLAAGQLGRRVQPNGPRELKELGIAFNAMADDLQRAQQQLDEERMRLAVTIESLGDALIVTEPASSRIAAINPRTTELVPDLVVGGYVDDPSSPLPPLDTALAGETVVEYRGRVLTVTAARLGAQQEGVVWTVHDMSDRARLERAKSEFVATASHELRSPLTSIKGFVELLARGPEGMSDRQREFVDIILRSTDRLVDLVNDLLDVARIEADRVEINRRPIDIGEAVREVTELMGPQLEEKHQQLGIYIAPTLPLALADPSRVRQIVANLITNAHLYTPDGGRIHVGAEADRAWIEIVVADSGVGMSKEETERMFERFYRGGDGGRSGPGTGLGLSIVKSLVEMHDGEINVDSEPGHGTTFRVRLPIAITGADSARSLDAIRGRRVLVVDDEREIAELIAGQLAAVDVNATIASSGDEALALLRSDRFDALTLDILMPGRDGFAVLREIRNDSELRSIPIVFVSVFSSRSELAGEWVVTKPIDADELRDVLAAAVRAGRSRVIVVGREEMQPVLEPALDDLGIEHQWEYSGPAAARVCGERRFEVALVDVGIRNPKAVLQALDLRGRRLRRAVILFSDGLTPVPAGVSKLGMEVVPVNQAAATLLTALRGEREE